MDHHLEEHTALLVDHALRRDGTDAVSRLEWAALIGLPEDNQRRWMKHLGSDENGNDVRYGHAHSTRNMASSEARLHTMLASGKI